MAKHALLSASGAHRWLECTPSALLELQFPQSTSEYAEEGTAAHELCELTARYFLGEGSEMDFENRRDELAKGPYYNAEMQECANDYARFVTEKTKAAQESCEDAFTELEVRVDFSKYVKDGFGTGDCIIVADKVLEIVDFKYGKGVRVEATGNPQMRLYALGALLKYNTLFDIDSVRMTIFQPRLSGVQSSDEITVKELLEWAEKYVKPRAKLAYKGEGEFAPSEEVCKFCRAKAQCKARADKNLKLFDEAPDAMLLTPKEAGAILEKAADIQAWLTDLEGLVSSTLLSGQPVTGWKMVEGRSNRKFADELKVVEAISCDYGTLNPTSAGLWGLCEGKWYRVREYYYDGRKERYQRTDEEHYAAIEELAGDLSIRKIIVDPSAASFIEVIRRHDRFMVEQASNRVLDGIRDVATRLNAGDIFFCDCCTDCIREFGLYRWDEKAAEDRPLKTDDHAMDDTRYFVRAAFQPSRFSF